MGGQDGERFAHDVVGDLLAGDRVGAAQHEVSDEEDEVAAVVQGGAGLSPRCRTMSLSLHDRLLTLLTSGIGRGFVGVYKDP